MAGFSQVSLESLYLTLATILVLLTSVALILLTRVIRRGGGPSLIGEWESAAHLQKRIEAAGLHNLEAELRMALEKNPEDFETLKRLVMLYLGLKTRKGWDRAFSIAKEHKRAFDDRPEYHALLAQVYSQLEDPSLARSLTLQSAVRAVELAPQSPDWYRLLGYSYWQFGDVFQAIDETTKALEIAEKQNNQRAMGLAKGDLAYYYAIQGDPKRKGEALSFAREACKVKRGPAQLDTLATVLIRFGDDESELDEAERILEEARKLPGTQLEIIDSHIKELSDARRQLPQRLTRVRN